MEVKKVYVIIGDDYTKEKAKEEIKAEGYKFNFHFNGDANALKEADEVWLFGNCNKIEDYRLSKLLGKDIWGMS